MSGETDLSGAIAALTGGSSGGDISEKLSSVLGGDIAKTLPELMKNVDLSALLSALGQNTESDKKAAEDGGTKSGSGGDAAAALPTILASLSKGGDERSSQRRALLTALRPFVSDKRKKAIDALVGMEKLTAILPGVK